MVAQGGAIVGYRRRMQCGRALSHGGHEEAVLADPPHGLKLPACASSLKEAQEPGGLTSVVTITREPTITGFKPAGACSFDALTAEEFGLYPLCQPALFDLPDVCVGLRLEDVLHCDDLCKHCLVRLPTRGSGGGS